MYRLKDDDDELKLQEYFGYVPYGQEVMVRFSPSVGEPLYWTYLMSVGGAAAFGTNYAVVKAASIEELVDEVQARLESGVQYLLHGLPSKEEGYDVWRQTLLEWNPAIVYSRGRQLYGSFVAQHYREDVRAVAEVRPNYAVNNVRVFFAPYVKGRRETDFRNKEFYDKYDPDDTKTFALELFQARDFTDRDAERMKKNVVPTDDLVSRHQLNDPLNVFQLNGRGELPAGTMVVMELPDDYAKYVLVVKDMDPSFLQGSQAKYYELYRYYYNMILEVFTTSEFRVDVLYLEVTPQHSVVSQKAMQNVLSEFLEIVQKDNMNLNLTIVAGMEEIKVDE